MSETIDTLEQAEAALAAGALDRVAQFTRQRLAMNPDDLDALLLAGDAANEMSRFVEAGEMFTRVLRDRPDDVRALAGLSVAALGARDAAAALRHAQRAYALAPDDVNVLMALGAAAISVRSQPAIDESFRRVQTLDHATGASVLEYWTRCLTYLGRFGDAVQVYKSIIDAEPPSAERDAAYASYLLQAHHVDDAVTYVERSLAAKADNPSAHMTHARAKLALGDIKGAVAAAREALKLNPDQTMPYTIISENAPDSITDEDIERLRAFIDASGGRPTISGIVAGRALGATLETRGDFDGAFNAFATAAAMDAVAARGTGHGYDRGKAEHQVDALIRAFPAHDLHEPHPDPDRGAGLIFVCGMPRSGTTLVDSILAAHSKVESVGESRGMPIIDDLFKNARPGASYNEIIEANTAQWDKLYRDLLNGADQRAQFVVDKMPANAWRIGLISRLYPGASILMMERDPMDVCWSIFRNHFRLGSMYPILLEDLVHHYKCYERVRDHWIAARVPRLGVVQYDRLLDDFEAEVRAILNHCGLAFEPACLKFQETKRAVFTHSAAQVRQGINKNFRGRWRRYEAQLADYNRMLHTR